MRCSLIKSHVKDFDDHRVGLLSTSPISSTARAREAFLSGKYRTGTTAEFCWHRILKLEKKELSGQAALQKVSQKRM